MISLLDFSVPLPQKALIAAAVASRVPEYASDWCKDLCLNNDFAFTLKGKRQSKLGDFTARPGWMEITLNNDLAPELFLITFLHELAHLHAFLKRKRREAPHGQLWQKSYGKLLSQLCAMQGIRDDLRKVLLIHTLKPTATLHADAALARVLHLPERHTPQCAHPGITIEMVETGHCFHYRGRSFLKSGKMNKRHYATEMDSGRMFMFPPTSQIKMIERATNIYRGLTTCLADTLEPGELFTHRNREFFMDNRVRSRLNCIDTETGQKVVLHNLMHVGIRQQELVA